jgi:hypothetical protein
MIGGGPPITCSTSFPIPTSKELFLGAQQVPRAASDATVLVVRDQEQINVVVQLDAVLATFDGRYQFFYVAILLPLVGQPPTVEV